MNKICDNCETVIHCAKYGCIPERIGKPAQQGSVDIAALVEGMEVSIDVSTGDHDSGNRLFGTVTLVQENQGSKHGLILLVQDPEANFKTAFPQPAQQEPVLMFYEQELQGKTSRAYQWLIDPFSLPKGTKLYTSPQPAQRKWVGLTHDEYDAICDKHSAMWDFDFLEDIEAKLKEKNT